MRGRMNTFRHARMSRWSMLFAIIVVMQLPLAAEQTPNGVYYSLAEALQHADVATTLILNKTPLDTLPASIRELQKLRTLILHRNGLKRLPPELSLLKNLRAIYLGGSPAL